MVYYHIGEITMDPTQLKISLITGGVCLAAIIGYVLYLCKPCKGKVKPEEPVIL